MFSVCQAAVFLLSISPSVITEDIKKAVLEIQYLPILFGKDAYLYCDLSSFPDCCSNTVTWMRNSHVIIHHGVSVNNLKYTQERKGKGFHLQIKHFESTDMNVAYSCLYKFTSGSKYLQINEYDFEMLPSASNTYINTTVNPVFHKIIAELLFEKVFPRPHCTLLADDQELVTATEIDWNMNGLFYRTTIVLSANYTTDFCDRSINISCTIGRNKRINYLGSNRTINCSDIRQTTFTERSYQSSIIISMVSLLVFTASLVLTGGIYRFRKHTNGPLSLDYDEERIPLLEQEEICFQNDATGKTAGSTWLEKTVCIIKSLPPKDKELVESDNKIWEQWKTYKNQGKYDENRGNRLFPPTLLYRKDPGRSTPFQKAKDLKTYFMNYVQMVTKGFSSQLPKYLQNVNKFFRRCLRFET